MLGIARQKIGKRPITEITARELLEVLRPLEAKGHLETARRLRAVMSQVFRFAVATARAENDPTYGLRGALAAPKTKHRAAITDPKELGALLRAIEGFAGQPTTKAALKLMAYLFARPGELRQAEWREFDLGGAIWTIPDDRTKMRREHRVPLPTQALEILNGLRELTGYGSLLFPGYGRSGGPGRRLAPRPLSENTLNTCAKWCVPANLRATRLGNHLPPASEKTTNTFPELYAAPCLLLWATALMIDISLYQSTALR